MWDPAWLAAGTHEIHGDLPDPLFAVPSHRTLGLMLAGEGDTARFRGYGARCRREPSGTPARRPDRVRRPDTGISFVYLTNGLDANVLREASRTSGLANRAGCARGRLIPRTRTCSSIPPMAMPTGIPVIETFLGFPSQNRKDVYKFLAPHLPR
jgi:hypothetical protein